MSNEPDVDLSVALAEYEYLRESRRSNDDKGTARFNYYVVVAAAAAAVGAGTVTSAGGLDNRRIAAIAAVGLLLLLLGMTIFVKQVEQVLQSRRYVAATLAIRTYLARRAPEVAPYLLLRTFDAPGVPPEVTFLRDWIREGVSITGMIGVLNSALIAGLAAIAGRYAQAPPWMLILASTTALILAILVHLVYARTCASTAARNVERVLAVRFPTKPSSE